MQKHKNKIIAVAVVFVVLAGLFWWGGSASGLHGWSVDNNIQMGRQYALAAGLEKSAPENLPLALTLRLVQEQDLQLENEQGADKPPVAEPAENKSENEPVEEINQSTGLDKYQTDPVPEGKPLSVEPQEAVIGEAAYTCTISISCATILDNPDWLNPEKTELVPEDGVILSAQTVAFYEGESVFNVLLRICKQQGIHMEYSNTPVYNSAYIEGIHNLYEFDCGEGSGWMYKVNDWFPNYGCSRYQLADGDVIEWVFTCNYGDDVGGGQVVGG